MAKHTETLQAGTTDQVAGTTDIDPTVHSQSNATPKPFDPTDPTVWQSNVTESDADAEIGDYAYNTEKMNPAHWKFKEFRYDEIVRLGNRLERSGWLPVKRGGSYQGIPFEDMLLDSNFDMYPDGVAGRGSVSIEGKYLRENTLYVCPIAAWEVAEKARVADWERYLNQEAVVSEESLARSAKNAKAAMHERIQRENKVTRTSW